MESSRRLWCRIVQGVLHAAIPLLPYREPELIPGCADAAKIIRGKGKTRALIVTDAGVRSHGLLQPVLDALAAEGIEAEIFDKTAANPTVSDVEGAFSLYREKKCDAIIAIGGGSPMDCAKGVCARVIKPRKSLLSMKGTLKVRGKAPLFLAVPTTAGTGSETTIAAVLTDETTHHKFTVLSFCLAPRYALLDPVMTRSLPPAQTAETGMDALTHAVEAYIGRSTTRATRRLAVEAVTLIKNHLPAAYADGSDLAARKGMQIAAYKAGMAFTVSYVGYVHAVAHSLGGAYNYPHGRTNATLLPIVLRTYGASCAVRLSRLARACGICDGTLSDMDATEAFISWVEQLNREMGIPASLDIKEEDIPALARAADAEANPLYPVPKLMDAVELEEIYRRARRAQ